MKKEHPSLSRIQIIAQEEMLDDFERKHNGLKLLRAKPVKVGDKSTIIPDGYSKDDNVVCEAWAHVGKVIGGQPHKVTNDVLKMLLLEKSLGKKGKKLKKFYIFVDDEDTNKASAKFSSGTSWKAACFHEFNIEPFLAKLSPETHIKLLKAQKDQKEGIVKNTHDMV